MPAKILVFDSGLGGLTVLAQIAELRPDANCVYVADDAVFPYGRLGEVELVERVMALMAALIPLTSPDIVVIACNTASTLVLPGLRATFSSVPFVGTVPAIKPGAQASRSGMVSVLATPGTVARDYTQGLVREFAAQCQVTLVGATRLAALAERCLRGQGVADSEIAAEIAPAFVEGASGRTDVVVLACTHFPLLLGHLRRLAPWEVTWIDPAPAIARRADQLLRARFGPPPAEPARLPHVALFTSGLLPVPPLAGVLQRQGLVRLDWCFPATQAQGVPCPATT